MALPAFAHLYFREVRVGIPSGSWHLDRKKMTNQMKLLLVEDNEVDAQMVAMVLTRSPELDVCVDHVTTLRDAIAQVYDTRYDAVLLDLGLPDSSGLEAVPRIKQATPTTPLVISTGHDDGDAALAAIRYGAQEYLSKEHVLGHL